MLKLNIASTDDELVSRLPALLADLGVRCVIDWTSAAGGQAQLELSRGSATQRLVLHYGDPAPLTVLAGTSLEPTLMFTSYISAKTGAALREAGVQYIDSAGNAWIHFGDVLIDIRGRPRADGRVNRPRASGNLFSTSRAQVVLALLAWPQLWDATQRDIASAACVSLGQAHNTLGLLNETGYNRERAGRTGLLDLWAAAFPMGLGRRLILATYRADRVDRKVAADDTVAISGEVAADDFLTPTSLTLYVRELDPHLPIMNRWRADGDANVVVRRMFWIDPEAPTDATRSVSLAPWPLVYADLLASTNPRSREAATQWKRSHG